MDQFILLLIIGIGPGALIAGLSLSVVVNYRGSGVINFGAGAMAMLGAYLFYGLRTGGYLFWTAFGLGGPLGTAPAFIVAVVVSGMVGLLLDVVLYRRLRNSPPLAKLLASVGVLLTLQALIILRFGGNGQSEPQVLGGGVVKMLGGAVPTSRFVLVGLVAVLTAVLAVVYRVTRFGLATRAAQEDEVESGYSGLSADWLASTNAVIAAVLASALGIVVAPLTSLDPNTLVLAVVPALGAALFARFTSFVVAGCAGLGMGVLEAAITSAQTKSWFPTSGGLPLPGVADLAFFLLICAALVWRGSSLPERGALVEPRLPRAPEPNHLLRPLLGLTSVAALGLILLPADFRQAMTTTLIGGIGCLSLVVLTGYLGQVSLLPYSLGGVAGVIVSKLAINAHIGFPLGPIVGVVAGVVLGTVTALPALRVRGVQLAILTVGAAVALQSFVLNNPSAGGGIEGSPVPSPHFFGINLGPSAPFPTGDGKLPSPVLGLVCLACYAGLASVVYALRRSSLGKQMLAVRSSERASSGVGLSPGQLKLAAFALSSGIAAVAGVLLAYNYGAVDVANFSLTNALALVAFAYMGGITTVRGSLIGGVLVTQGLLGTYLQNWLGISPSYYLLIGGIGLMVTVVLNPNGIALSEPPRWLSRLRSGRRPGPADAPGPDLVDEAGGGGVGQVAGASL